MSQSELYRAIFELNAAIKLVIDPATGAIVDANPAAVAFYGWPREVLRTMSITDINTLTQQEVLAEMENARALRRSYFRFRHRTASGEVRAVEVHSGPIAFEGRELLWSIIHDVTEREQLEEHLRRSQRLEAVGQLAGGIAHDFNNLLTVMMSAGQLARRHLADPAVAMRFLDEIDQAARRGADLTRQLMAFGRRQMMAPRPISVADTVERLVPLLERSLGPAHPVELRIEPAPMVMADPAQLEQVVMNLVLNARDAMPTGGAIEIVIGPAPGERVRLAVVDRGVGMDEATRARVFEPFFTTKPDGTGMGLASVYGIVAQTGGAVEVDSAPGAGSTFAVLLPVTRASAAIVRPRATTPNLRPKTILLVDDLAPVRTTIADLLRDAGHEVIAAASADEALRAARDHIDRIDLVLTDAVMPGRSGIDLILELRSQRADLACILMSGDLRDHAGVAQPARVVRLAKPFTLDELSAAVAGLIE